MGRVKASFEAGRSPADERRAAVVRPLGGRPARQTGPLVCTCFGVGLAAIRDAIATRAAANVEEIGRALKAGTNCGSCLPELKKIAAAVTP